MTNCEIKSIKGRPRSRCFVSLRGKEILDSRGNPTVKVKLTTNFGTFLASVPSGASKGQYEAFALSAKKAVRSVNRIIAPKLIGRDTREQKEIDNLLIKLDGTKNKSKLGANAILGVSMAVCRAGAVAQNLSLWQYIRQLAEVRPPLNLARPAFNLINGGAHAGNKLDFQEFMVVPQNKSFAENLRIGEEIYRKLKQNLIKKYGKRVIKLGDEGGFVPPIKFPEEAIELILEAAKQLNYRIKLILDVAISQFFKKGKYKGMKIGIFTRESLLRYYEKLIKNYPILGLEDPFSEEDWPGWQELKSKIKNQKSKVLVIGDDLTVTNPQRIKQAHKKKACNAIIVKPNQIGTVSETIRAAKLARSYGWKIMVSHRSGETNDDFIADLAAGIGADFIKAGAPFPKERMVKYNRLVKIEEEVSIR